MARVVLDGARAPELLTDLEETAREFAGWLDREPGIWEGGSSGKWSTGQHVDHVANTYALFAQSLEAAARELEAGTLNPRPRRGIFERAFVHMVTQSRRFPRGGRSPQNLMPLPSPARPETLARLRGEVARYRPLVERFSPEERGKLWIKNPATTFRWHYALPEILRLQAQHTRHHRRLAEAAVPRA